MRGALTFAWARTGGRSSPRTSRSPPTSSSLSRSPPTTPACSHPGTGTSTEPEGGRPPGDGQGIGSVLVWLLVFLGWPIGPFFGARGPTPGTAGLSRIRYESKGDEGSSLRQTDLRKVQGDPPWRRRARDLLESSPQAAAGLGESNGANRGSQHPSQQAGRGRSHLRLRRRSLHLEPDPPAGGRRPEHPGQGLDRGRDREAARGRRGPRG